MEKTFVKQFEALLEKYSELMVGESTEEIKEKVKMWALYSHIAKSMPALAKHWNGLYPDAKEEMKQIINEIKVMNEQHRSSSQK
ncbi:YusU family protein [Neobacillus sp. SuZ13]|uniref:YusU family protein n=1 Tax=Neobacillus sp. SuZ13 TaxID=3047875 RepID=UPI0024BF3A66|nr:YusU family protein [Neobacillus sp. SuZ13]WHY66236.1 YusU family protein [Neobacillus sp. SuZ13]